MCGCNSGGSGGGTPWGSNRTRYQVVSPAGTRVTYATREEAARHQKMRGGVINEVKPGTKG